MQKEVCHSCRSNQITGRGQFLLHRGGSKAEDRTVHETLIWLKYLNSLTPMPGDAVRQKSQFHQINISSYKKNPSTSNMPAQGRQICQRFSWMPATYQVATGDWAGYTSSSIQDNIRYLWFKQSWVPTLRLTWWAVLPTCQWDTCIYTPAYEHSVQSWILLQWHQQEADFKNIERQSVFWNWICGIPRHSTLGMLQVYIGAKATR